MMRVGRDSAGFRQLLAAIAEAAPGPRVAVCVEGSRSYGTGLARALAAAGLLVPGCEQPARRRRRGKGRSGPVEAHLAALRLDAGRLPVPRAGGGREALRILPVARQEITAACAGQSGRLRALLLAGDDTGRRAARTALPGRAPAALPGRELPGPASREQAVRQAGTGRLALPLSQARDQLSGNRARLLAIVGGIAPGLASRYGAGPVSAAQAIVSFCRPGRCRGEAGFAAPGGTSPIPASSGQTVRHRLSRGGDRALNRAIHAIALARMRGCPRDPRPRRPAHRRGKDRPGDPPLPQALHRPRALPVPHPDDESSREPLTNIEVVRVAACDALRG